MSELISGKEALIALANGDDVEYLEDDNKWHLIDKEIVVISALIDCKLRLKPRTVTLNGIEIPVTFEPKEGDVYFYLTNFYECGYDSRVHDSKAGTFYHTQAWRTREEIKQVVAALRNIFGKK